MKIRVFVILFVSSLLVLFISAAAVCAGMRCGTRLASIGNTKYEVLSKCGEPDYKTVRFEKRIKRDFFRDIFREQDLSRYESERKFYREPFLVEEFVEIEEWTYNLGPASFIRYLTFENDRLVDIATGGYGY